MGQDWRQTFVLIVTVVSASLGSMAWIQSQHRDILNTSAEQSMGLLTLVGALKVEQGFVKIRLEEGGWSRGQQQEWIDLLREQSGHPIPNISGPRP